MKVSCFPTRARKIMGANACVHTERTDETQATFERVREARANFTLGDLARSMNRATV